MTGSNRDNPGGSRSKGPAPRAPYGLVLGFERVGLIALRAPLLSAAIAAALCIAAMFGVAKLKVDDLLSSLFRSETAEFKHFEEFSKRFPSNEYDVLMVVEGAKLLERDSIEKLRDLVTDLQLIEGTRGVLSLFSARTPPENGNLPGPLFPADLPEGPEYDALVQKVLANEIIRGKLLSDDGKLALIVIALKPEIAAGGIPRAFGPSLRRFNAPHTRALPANRRRGHRRHPQSRRGKYGGNGAQGGAFRRAGHAP